MPLPLLAAAAPGLIQAGASLFGAGKRKKEQAAAQRQFDADSAAVRNFQFENPNANLENTAEDLTINQQASQFQAQQNDASLSQGLDQFVQSGGGGGGAQAFAQAALQAKQGISADIAGQESANQALRAQQAAANQTAEAQGALALQNQQHSQLTANQGQSGQRLGAANASIQQAKSAFASGLGSAAGGVLGAGGDNLKAGLNFFGGEKKQETPLTRQSPFKNTGDGTAAVSYNPETKKYEGEGINRARTGQVTTGVGNYSRLRQLYGDTGYAAGGEDSKRLTGGERAAARDAWVAEGGSPEAFNANYSERDSALGQQWIQGQLAQQGRVQEDEAAFRQGQSDAFAGLDETGRREASLKLEQALRANPELRRSITGSGKGSHQAKKALGELFGKNRSERGEFTPERFQSVLKGLERAGVNPREYLQFLQPKEAPTKRMKTPFYRTKWMGGVSK